MHEDAQVIPLHVKEGLGAVDRDAAAGTHHPLPLLRQEGESFSWLEGDSRAARKRRKEARKCEKDVKIEGTISLSPLESTKVPKNKLKTNWF
jgi:hypothetical protein